MEEKITDIFYDVETGKQYIWAGDHYEYLPPQPKPPEGPRGGNTPPPPIPGNNPPKPQKPEGNKPKPGKDKKDEEDPKKPIKPEKPEEPEEPEEPEDPVTPEEPEEPEEPGDKGKGKKGDESEDGDDTEDGDLESDEEFKNRIAKIRKLLSNPEWQEAGVGEVIQKVQSEKVVKAKKEKEKLKAGSPIMQFTDSLNDFIRRQIKTGSGTSWSKINKKYAHSGIIKPGHTRRQQKNIPLISVYFDQSSSWNEDDIAVGMQALNTLQKYQDDGKIEIEKFYFSNDIYDSAREARADGGTAAGEKLILHIKDGRNHANGRTPDNVIVMTDGDFDSWDEITKAPNIHVPGAVWFLFRGKESKRLQQHLKGDTVSKKFMLEG